MLTFVWIVSACTSERTPPEVDTALETGGVLDSVPDPDCGGFPISGTVVASAGLETRDAQVYLGHPEWPALTTLVSPKDASYRANLTVGGNWHASVWASVSGDVFCFCHTERVEFRHCDDPLVLDLTVSADTCECAK